MRRFRRSSHWSTLGSRLRRLPAFTLIELLCVVAIICILAGLLMPSLATISQKADSITCAANLSGIGSAVQSYLQDHNFIYPEIETDPATMSIYSGVPNATPVSMLAAFGPYGITTKTLQCPADMKSPNSSYKAIATGTGSAYATSYDWKPTLDDESPNEPLVYLPHVRFGAAVSGTAGNGNIIVQAKLSKIRQVFDDNFGIHFGHVNALYADGHVISWTGPVTH
jgi:prepilin-type N-terminal cleavage/methylation domain-containing protein/prepilin-type processing-associated H-X9-DG protein